MSDFMKVNKEIEKAVVTGYQAIEDGVVGGYKAIENGVVEGFKGVVGAFMPTSAQEETETTVIGQKTAVAGYNAIEKGVVGGYKKIEDGVVGVYKKVENKFVDAFLTSDEPASEKSDDIKK